MNKSEIESRIILARPTLSGLVQSHVFVDVMVALITTALGLVVARLIVSGNWHIAAALIFTLPAVIVLHRYPFVALLIWLVLTPFLIQTPTALERQIYWAIHRGLPVATLGIMVISSALKITRRSLPRLSWPEVAMAGYMVVTVVSILYMNSSPKETLYIFYDRVFSPMCLYLIIRLSSPGEKGLKWLVPVTVFITVSQFMIGMLSWAAPSLLPSQWLGYAGERTTGTLNSVSVYSTTLIFCGLFLLNSAFVARPGLRRALLILTFLVSLYSIFISFSRASWLAGLLVILGLVYLYPRFFVKMTLFALPVILVMSATILVKQLDTANERLSSSGSNHSALSRLPVYLAAYRMFEAKPIWGWGYSDFNRYDRQFQGRVAGLVNPDEKDHSVHNVYLNLLAEQGLVGFGLFLTPLFWWFIRSWKAYRGLGNSGFVNKKLLFILWLVILSHFVVNNLAPMVVVFGLGMWWITLGLIANIVQTRPSLR